MLSNVAAPLPKFVHLLILRNCESILLPGIRDFTEMIKLRVSCWENHPGLSECFQCNHIPSYKEGGKKIRKREDTRTEAELRKERRYYCPGFEDGGRGYEPRNEGSP